MDVRDTFRGVVLILVFLTAAAAADTDSKRGLTVQWKAFHWPRVVLARKSETKPTGHPCGTASVKLTTTKTPPTVTSKIFPGRRSTLATVTRKSRAAEISCPGSFIQSTVGNFCFMTSMRRLPYKDAKAYCSKNKGILVSVESKDKHSAVVTFLKRNHFGSDATFWLSPIGNSTKKFWLSNMAPVNFENFKENTVSLQGSCNIIGLMDEKWMKQGCRSVLTVNHQNITNIQYVVCEPLNTSTIFNNLVNSGVVKPNSAKNIASSKNALAIMQKIKIKVEKMVKKGAVQEPVVATPTVSPPPQNTTSLWNRFKSFIGR